MLNDEIRSKLIQTAIAVRDNAYAPYSKFKVGAAALTDTGMIYSGCNVENSSYGLTICAERIAIGTAVAQGNRQVAAVCIVAQNAVAPCGACRQFINEFGPRATILLVDAETGKLQTETTLDQLLPHSFQLDFEPPSTS